jgi:hypothetical protein
VEPNDPRSVDAEMGKDQTPVRVVLADNHTMFMEGLAAILACRGGVEVVEHAPTGENAFACGSV